MEILEDFVLGLSDQQLITGLLVLIVAYAKYLPGNNTNLFIAGDLVFFSNITHASTLMILRTYLRQHRKWKWCRIYLMYLTSWLWIVQACIYLVVFTNMHHSSPVPPQLAFYSEIVQIIGVIWINIVVLLPLIISEKAIMVRDSLSRPSQTGLLDVEAGILDIQEDCRKTSRWNLGRGFTKFYVWFCQKYIRQRPTAFRGALWITLEVVFPWYTTIYILVGLFMFGLVFLVLDVQDSGISYEWGFGQLLPTFLILLPIFTIFETFTGTCGSIFPDTYIL